MDGWNDFCWGLIVGMVVSLLILILVTWNMVMAPTNSDVRVCEFAGHATAVNDVDGNTYCVPDYENLVLFEAAD